MKKLLIISLTIILVSILIFSGCGEPEPAETTSTPSPTTSSTQPEPTETSPSVPEPQYGGVFRQLETSGPTNIGDPAVVPSIPTYYRVASESLFFLEPDGTPVPRLATSWEFAPDDTYVTFNLRDDVNFQDGTKFNAEAVKFCLDRGINGEAPGLKPVTSVEVIDEYTVRVNWPGFDYSVWDSLGGHKGPSWIISPTSVQENDPDWPKLNIVGVGPFKLVSYERDVGLKYERFDDYWQEGLPYLDGVEFKLVADQTTALMAFKAGEAEMITRLTPADTEDLRKSGYEVIETPGWSQFLAFSSANDASPFSDLKVRQAVIYAVDTKAVAEGIGRGFYLPSNQPYPPSSWAFNPDIKGYPYNPEKARELLTEAGYPDGFQTKIFMRPGPQEMQIAVQSYLKAVGIEAKIEALSPAAIADMMASSGWDGLMSGQLIALIGGDPGAGMQGMGFVNRGVYYTSVMRTDDTLNLLNQANGTHDRAAREAALKEMCKLIIDEYAMILPVYHTVTLTAVQPYVHDIGIDQFGYTYDLAWLSK